MMNQASLGRLLLGVLAFTSLSVGAHSPQVRAGEVFPSFLIRLSDGNKLSVQAISTSKPLQFRPTSEGLIIWPVGSKDTWEYVAPGCKWSPQRKKLNAGGTGSAELFAQSRGRGGSADSSGSGQLTTQIDQLLSGTVFRGKGLITPHNGRLLDGRIVIRRQPETAEPHFPKVVVNLARGNVFIARIEFPENQSKLNLDQMPALVKFRTEGLAPGEYTLRREGGSESTTFTIEERERAKEVSDASSQLAALLGNHTDPLFIQAAVESLLDQQDEDGKPLSYLTDALNLLESVPEQTLSIHLRSLHANILRRLRGEKQEVVESNLVKTGIPSIDQVRQHIAAGKWREALEVLDHQIPDEPRASSLAKLHRAVILAQSGLGKSELADGLFREACDKLRSGSDYDRFLAFSNAGNFYLNHAQDQLYNHAFQMETGASQPLLAALKSWRDADSAYGAAFAVSQNQNFGIHAGLLINIAHAKTLLADIIQTLDVPDAKGLRSFEHGEAIATKEAADLAAKISSAAPADVEPLVRATAEEIQAHLAYRANRTDECLNHAQRARVLYLDAGSLSGVEGVHRLLGMHYWQQSKTGMTSESGITATDLALKHFLISMQLAELLRSRIPADDFGLAQAGFFARRAYVNEQVIDLLVAKNRATEALRIAEQAKARSLQDLLASQRHVTSGTDRAETRTIGELLDEWPKGVAAIEYFIGTEKAWRFVVDGNGTVHAKELLRKGQSSREFVGEVRRLLASLDGAPRKGMLQRFKSNRPFDTSWQDKLLEFQQILIPQDVLTQLQRADTVVVVPHHILHYFPFATLVTQRDEKPRGVGEMVQPKFLIDEKFDLIYAPSLGVWDLLRGRPDQPLQKVNAVGIVDFPSADPLPGVAKDLENLKSALGTRNEVVLFAEDATESNVQTLLRQPGMLLFATHGCNLPTRPLESYLLCLKDQQNDGHLTAAELFTFPIEARLIVMSACYSGLADQSPLPGDDLFGIQRAFLNSGASTVVSGLWDVSDLSGPMLMNGFFTRLANGQPAHAALAASQRQFLQDCRAPGSKNEILLHPYFWAVYTAVGDNRTHFLTDGDKQ